MSRFVPLTIYCCVIRADNRKDEPKDNYEENGDDEGANGAEDEGKGPSSPDASGEDVDDWEGDEVEDEGEPEDWGDTAGDDGEGVGVGEIEVSEPSGETGEGDRTEPDE